MPQKLSVEDLEGIISRELSDTAGSSQLSGKRQKLIDRYFAELYGDEQEGFSQVVDTTPGDVVDWAMPFLIKTLLGAERICSFVPVGQEDEQAAEQETDIVNHAALQLNSGFLWVYSLLHDALVQVVGYVDIDWQDTYRRTTDRYRGLTDDELVNLLEQLEQTDGRGKKPKVDILTHDEREEPAIDPATGQPAMQLVHDVKIRVTNERVGRPRIINVAAESVIVADRHNSILLDDAPLCGWKEPKTRSDLVAMGIDPDCVEAMPAADDTSTASTAEAIARRLAGQNNQTLTDSDAGQGAMSRVSYAKIYVRADLDGDGEAELLCAHCDGDGQILKWAAHMRDMVDSVSWPYCLQEVEFVGLVAATPYIVPHRHQGRSMVEKVVQLAQIKTTLKRQLVNNVTLLNNPRLVVYEDGCGDSTLNDLLDAGPAGSIVKATRPQQGGEAIVPLVVPPMIDDNLKALEYFDQETEKTSISRLQSGLDSDALNKTWRGQADMRDAANETLLLIARAFAEVAFKPIMQKIHALFRKHGAEPMARKLRSQWVEVDPREWRERSDMTVDVGLGTGNKDQQLAHMVALGVEHDKLLSMGGVKPQHIYNRFAKLAELAGFRQIDQFATDPMVEEWQPPPAPEDPLVAIERMKTELQGQKINFDARKVEVEAATKEQELALEWAKLEHMRQKDAAELGIKAGQLQTSRHKIEVDAETKILDIASARQSHEEQRHDTARTKAVDMQQADRHREQDMADRAEERKLKGALAKRKE